jgi:hypothetical protein
MIINWIWTSVMIPVYSHEGICRYCKCWCPIPFCLCDTWNIRDLIVDIFIPSSISLPTLPFTRSRDTPSSWPSHMLQHWMNLTEWAQSIFPSRGRTNPALDTYASTYSIGKPMRHLFSHCITEWRLMQSKLPPEVVIKYDLSNTPLFVTIFK